MKLIASLIVVKQSSRLARACLRLRLGPGCLALIASWDCFEAHYRFFNLTRFPTN